MSKNKKVFSGLSRLPKGLASDQLTEGCIVLEGGAFRGLYTSGVLDALMEAGINLSCTVGVSAGALNGMNYVSGQIGRSGRLNLTYRHDSRYVGLKAIRKNRGVIGFDFILKNVNKEDPLNEERFFRPDSRFVVVATDCITMAFPIWTAAAVTKCPSAGLWTRDIKRFWSSAPVLWITAKKKKVTTPLPTAFTMTIRTLPGFWMTATPVITVSAVR